MSDELLLDRQLCFALYSAQRALTRAYAELLAPLGITYPQYLVFLLLWEKDGRAVKDLGTCLELDSGTLTPLLKRLEQRELVERRRDPEDERSVKIFLTPEGRALKTKAKKVPAGLLAKARMTDRHAVGRLRDELRDLASRLDAPSD